MVFSMKEGGGLIRSAISQDSHGSYFADLGPLFRWDRFYSF